MGKSDIEIALLRHRKARIRVLRRSQTPIVVPLDEKVSSMNLQVYNAAKEGSFDAMPVGIDIGNERTPKGNTVLHLAADFGHTDLVRLILDRMGGLAMVQNFYGDLALHVAAASGHESVVAELLRYDAQRAELAERERRVERAARITQNKEGNTALHVALKHKHEKVAEELIDADSEASFVVNNDGVSPLYMAAEAGYEHLVKRMLGPRRDLMLRSGQGRKSVLHAGIRSRNKAILNALLLADQGAHTNSRDENGRTLISYAALIGYYEGVKIMLSQHTEIAYERNTNGCYAIHTASMKGHTNILNEILTKYPDTIELLNGQGQNALHVAAKSGRTDVVKYILGRNDFVKLINQQDNEGNTPFHLAAIHCYPRVVHILAEDLRVSLEAVNKKGFTALDAAEECMESNPTFRERLTWMALVCAGTPRALKLIPLEDTLTQDQASTSQDPAIGASTSQAPSIQSSTSQDPAIRASTSQAPAIQSSTSQDPAITTANAAIETYEKPNAKRYKDRVNTLLLVAILVATVTFSAGFIVPGAENIRDLGFGAETSAKRRAFHGFIVCNTIAMYSSVLSTAALIWAQLGDLKLILTVFKPVLPLLGISLVSMSGAFVAGVYVVVGDHSSLSVFLLVLGCVFFFFLLLLIIPFILPYTSSKRLFRYIFRYPFLLLLATVWNDTDDEF